jgi:GNAT superfamily N-acetyltransferase
MTGSPRRGETKRSGLEPNDEDRKTPVSRNRTLDRYRIRPARAADVPVLTRFILEEAREAEGRILDPLRVTRGVRRAVVAGKVPRYWVMLRRRTATIVASISAFYEWSDWRAAPYWWVQSLYVAEPERGHGRARERLGFVEGAAARSGAVELRLYVHRGNTRAARLYRRAGFRATSYDLLRKPVTGAS